MRSLIGRLTSPVNRLVVAASAYRAAEKVDGRRCSPGDRTARQPRPVKVDGPLHNFDLFQVERVARLRRDRARRQ